MDLRLIHHSRTIVGVANLSSQNSVSAARLVAMSVCCWSLEDAGCDSGHISDAVCRRCSIVSIGVNTGQPTWSSLPRRGSWGHVSSDIPTNRPSQLDSYRAVSRRRRRCANEECCAPASTMRRNASRSTSLGIANSYITSAQSLPPSVEPSARSMIRPRKPRSSAHVLACSASLKKLLLGHHSS